MGDVIVAALLIVGACIAATVVIITQGPALGMSVDSVIESQRNTADMIKSDIEIVSAEADDVGQTIDVWLKNTGALNIKPVSALDVILRSVDGRRGEYVSHGGTPGNGWVAVPASRVVWNRGESLRIQIALAVPLPLGVYKLAVTTPKGVTAEQPFEVVAPAIHVPRVSRRIAFTSYRDGNAEIYTMRDDGTDIIRLTDNPRGDWRPSWSPDGSRIVFESDRHGNLEIYVMNADGSGPTRLTNNNRQDEAPVWSPDGGTIAFQSNARPDGHYEIFSMNADGSDQKRLIKGDGIRQHESPKWSPAGNEIAYNTHQGFHERRNSFVTDIGNSAERKLTNLGTDDGSATWSRDGVRIALEVWQDGNLEIYAMNANGTNPIRLTNNLGNDRLPSWSRDGTRIVFESDRDGDRNIYAMNSDGTGQVRLTKHRAHDEFPAWSWSP